MYVHRRNLNTHFYAKTIFVQKSSALQRYRQNFGPRRTIERKQAGNSSGVDLGRGQQVQAALKPQGPTYRLFMHVAPLMRLDELW